MAQSPTSTPPNKIYLSNINLTHAKMYSQNGPKIKWFFLLYTVIFFLILVSLKLMWQQQWVMLWRLEELSSNLKWTTDESNCQIQLVESIPENLNFSTNSPTFLSTYDAWKLLLNSTEAELNIASFYWTMRAEDVINDTTAALGEDIFQRLVDLGSSGHVKIRIAQSAPTDKEPDFDTRILQDKRAAEVRSLNFTRLLGGGVLHTKFWISDYKHVYIGSANMDWRSLTQVKEMGVIAMNCPSLAMDLDKIFQAYWVLSTNTSKIPSNWPSDFSTEYNFNNPMKLRANDGHWQNAILSSSPPPLTANGRIDDVNAILQVIKMANKFVNIAVMDYIPLMIYTQDKIFWPVIDNALRSAAIDRKIQIKLLISWWKHSNPSEDYFLKSLLDINNAMEGVDIQIKRFIVPANDKESVIPFGRVNHNKYMVTDNVAYIGTSNWSGDYFTNTAGVGLIFPDTAQVNGNATETTLRQDLLSVFERDWNSPYVKDEDFIALWQ